MNHATQSQKRKPHPPKPDLPRRVVNLLDMGSLGAVIARGIRESA